MHELLCKNSAKYRQDRQRLARDFKVGEAGLAAAITATIVPYLGGSSIVAAPAVAITLTMISRASLSTWCSQRGDARKLAEDQHREAMAEYEKARARHKVDMATYEKALAEIEAGQGIDFRPLEEEHVKSTERLRKIRRHRRPADDEQ